MENLLKAAQSIADIIAGDRHELHRRAEVGFDLHETIAYVRQTLQSIGLTPRDCGKCGLIADIGEGEDAVLLRADMDALPIREESGVPFACENGNMHACGHDMHTAMLLGAARLLKAREKELPGKVRLMFQPAEEPLAGAADMLENGLLADFKPRAASMIHVLTNIELPVGTAIVTAPGVSAPAAAMFEVRIQGKGCHGAMPHTGIDPLLAAAHTVIALEAISTRELSLNDAHALTIGMLHAGETANVIPDTAILRGSMRAFDSDAYEHIIRRIREVSEGTAATFRATAEMSILQSTNTLVNDAAVSAAARAALTDILGANRVLLSSDLSGAASKSSGSEDFAQVSHAVPSVMIALAAGRPQDGCNAPAHHPCTRFDEAALPVGAAAYAALGMMKMVENEK